MDPNSFDDTGALVQQLGMLFEAHTGQPFSYTDFAVDELYVLGVIETALASEYAELRNIAAHLRTRLLGSVETITLRDADPLARTRRHATLSLPETQAQLQLQREAARDAHAAAREAADAAAEAEEAARQARQAAAAVQRDADLLSDLAALAAGTLPQNELFSLQLVESALLSQNPAVRHAAAHARMRMDVSVEVITLRDADPMERTRRYATLQPLQMPLFAQPAPAQAGAPEPAAPGVQAQAPDATAAAGHGDTELLPGLAAVAAGAWDKGELLALQLVETALLSANPEVREAAARARACMDVSIEEITVHDTDPMVARSRGYAPQPLSSTGPQALLVQAQARAGAAPAQAVRAGPGHAVEGGLENAEEEVPLATAEDLALIAQLDALDGGAGGLDGLQALRLVEEARFAGHPVVREAAARAQARLLESMEVIEVDDAQTRAPARRAAPPPWPPVSATFAAPALAASSHDAPAAFGAGGAEEAALAGEPTAGAAQGNEIAAGCDAQGGQARAVDTRPVDAQSADAQTADAPYEPNEADLALLAEMEVLRAAPELAGGLRALQVLQQALQSPCPQVRNAGEHLHIQLLAAMESITLSDDTTQRPPRRAAGLPATPAAPVPQAALDARVQERPALEIVFPEAPVPEAAAAQAVVPGVAVSMASMEAEQVPAMATAADMGAAVPAASALPVTVEPAAAARDAQAPSAQTPAAQIPVAQVQIAQLSTVQTPVAQIPLAQPSIAQTPSASAVAQPAQPEGAAVDAAMANTGAAASEPQPGTLSFTQIREEVAGALDALFADSPARPVPPAQAPAVAPALPTLEVKQAVPATAVKPALPDLAGVSIVTSGAVPPLQLRRAAASGFASDGRPDPGRRKQFQRLLAELEDLCARELQPAGTLPGVVPAGGAPSADAHAAENHAAGPHV